MKKEEIGELFEAISEDPELLNAFAKLVEKSIKRSSSLQHEVSRVVNEEIVHRLRRRGVT